MFLQILSRLIAGTLVVAASCFALTPSKGAPQIDPSTIKDAGEIAANAVWCYDMKDLGIRVNRAENDVCPKEEMVRDAIQYAEDIFGQAEVGGTSVVYTDEYFWCGMALAQGCTWNPGGGYFLQVVVSSHEAGDPAVTAHEYSHVIQIRNEQNVDDDHEPKDLWRLVNAYQGD